MILRNRSKIIIILVLVVGLISCYFFKTAHSTTGDSLRNQPSPINSLYVPTHFTKINDRYFITDSYHHRVIWSKSLTTPLAQWNTIPFDFAAPHAITFGDGLYVIDNTGNNELIVLNQNLEVVQVIPHIGKRPHRTIYDEQSDCFYTISSETQEVFCHKAENGALIEQYRKKLTFLDNKYVRNIKIMDGFMYFAGTNGKVMVVDYLHNFKMKTIYTLLPELGEPQDIEKYNGYYYLTFYNPENPDRRFIRTKSLDALQHGEYESVYHLFDCKSFPYYFSVVGDSLYFSEIGETNSIFLLRGQQCNLIMRFNGVTENDKIIMKKHSL